MLIFHNKKTLFKYAILQNKCIADAHPSFLLEEAILFLDVLHIDGLVQYCSISIANGLEILQSCTEDMYMYMAAMQTLGSYVCNKDMNSWYVCVNISMEEGRSVHEEVT